VKATLFGKPLPPGGTIGVSAPASPQDARSEVLRGVEWATASTILHACDARPYPILDVRALWSLGYTGAHVTLDLWLEYVACTRSLAARLGLGMRTLDRALWQYSIERQR